MAKRLTTQQKKEIVSLFISGDNIDEISQKFNFTKLTISRNIKNEIGEVSYKELLGLSKSANKLIKNKNLKISNSIKNKSKINQNKKKNVLKKITNEEIEQEFSKISEFIEIAPLNCDIENTTQKDLSSIPIADIDFPKTVFMIVDKKVELEIKFLKDYPEWQFLSSKELKRKTIQIYYDSKIAKSSCGKEQRVIKVPNTNVFKIVAPILLARGITRIVSSDKLIAL